MRDRRRSAWRWLVTGVLLLVGSMLFMPSADWLRISGLAGIVMIPIGALKLWRAGRTSAEVIQRIKERRELES